MQLATPCLQLIAPIPLNATRTNRGLYQLTIAVQFIGSRPQLTMCPAPTECGPMPGIHDLSGWQTIDIMTTTASQRILIAASASAVSLWKF
jgi:hypothetical protein